MAAYDKYVDYDLPFAHANDVDFKNFFTDTNLNFPSYNLNNLLSLNDIFSVTDEDDQSIPMANLVPECNSTKYITTDEICDLCISSYSLTFLQLNCRSLKQTFDHVKNLIAHFPTPPPLISLSETWLK